MNAPVRARVGLRVGSRTVDVAIPSGVPLYEVLREVDVDLDDPGLTIVDSAGRQVDLYSTTGDELPDGAVLHVVTRTPVARAAQGGHAAHDPAVSRPVASPWWLGVAGAGAVVLVAVVALGIVDGSAASSASDRLGLAVGVGLAALALAVLPSRPGAFGATWPTVVATLAGAAAGAVTVDPALAASGRLMAVAALAGATAVAAARWGTARRTRDAAADLAVVLVVVLGVAAAACAATLLLAVPAALAAAVLLGGVPLALRALPTLCVDVPDDQLVDVTHVARTAFAVRTPVREPLGAVNDRMVRRTVRSAEQRRDAGTVILSLTAPLSAPFLLAAAEPGTLTGWAALGACVLVLLVLALSPRTTRGVLVRWAPRVAAVALLLELATLGTVGAGDRALLGTVVALGLGLGVVALSLPIGRGWRSVGFSRFADVLEALGIALALPAALVAAGAIETFRLLTSG